MILSRKSVERNPDNLNQAEKNQLQSRGWRDRRLGEYPPVAQDCRPGDYQNNLSRGTISYDLIWRNYSFHNVIIPSGTVVKNCNFTQSRPKTLCITVVGGNVLKFISCNLGNVDIEPNWEIVGCNTCQFWIVEKEELDEKGVLVKSEDNQFIVNHSSKFNSSVHLPPPNVIFSRSF